MVPYDVDEDDLETMSAFYNYSEPFSCECRAFGRIRESGHDQVAVRCFGYLLLDEENERAIMNQFSHLRLSFEGNFDYPDYAGQMGLRSRFVAKGGRPPPVRGIVKEFGHNPTNLRSRDAQRILQDVTRLQQLGIIHIDVADRQLINGKLCDFSKAFTVPHYITTPELNPRLTPAWISAMEFETFQFSINDYWEFDDMVRIWNEEHDTKISVYAFPNGRGCKTKYNLRSTPSRRRVYSFVDPRTYDWKTSDASPGKKAPPVLHQDSKSTEKSMCSKVVRSKARRRLDARPPRWYLDCTNEVALGLKVTTSFSTSLDWEFKDGLMFPKKKT